MSGLEAIQAVSATANSIAASAATQAPVSAEPTNGFGFGDMLANGISQVENKVDAANEMVRTFAVDGSVPLHQVTIAVEEARMAVELAVQVRSRLVEGYREIMNMQL